MTRYRMRAALPDVTHDDVRALLAKADAQRGFWTFYVTHAGVVWLTDEEPPESAKFRWESYMPGSGYVGPKAAADARHVRKVTRDLIRDWKEGKTGYVDY